MESCKNLRARALYNVVMDFGMSVLVKHLALRFSRPDLLSLDKVEVVVLADAGLSLLLPFTWPVLV